VNTSGSRSVPTVRASITTAQAIRNSATLRSTFSGGIANQPWFKPNNSAA
jgi:hypothetical protein